MGNRTQGLSAPVETPSTSRGLAAEIAFLTAADIPLEDLAGATYRAARDQASAATTLIASGAIDANAYYAALARRVGLPFIEGWPLLAEPFDPVIALRRGRVRLAAAAGADWLVAPSDREIDLLLRAGHHAGIARSRVAITTPGHFCAIVREAGRRTITHAASEALPDAAPHLSAKGAADRSVGLAAMLCMASCAMGLWVSAPIVVDLLGTIFLASMMSRLMVCAAGIGGAGPTPLVSDGAAPFYTVLVPLHREVAMVRDLVAALEQLDYPRSKFEVLFLIEQDDAATREALVACRPPPNFRVIVIPNGTPRTKPRALNLGLMVARGDLVTVYDAEDRPEPDQLRKAAGAFAAAPGSTACVQARLAVSNAASGLLPRLFAIEYATLFDLFNVGAGRWGLPMALGGTSNHFRAAALRSVGGWDAYNVTEDADLGLRLARFGFSIGTLDSTTWETALGRLPAWLKQRRRWTKGWMQTLIVLGRDHRAARDLGLWKSLLVGLMLTHLVTGPLLTPVVIVIMAWHLREGLPDPGSPAEVIETALATSVLVTGVASTLWCGAMATRARPLKGAWICVPLMLPYQLLISLAAWGGLLDLVRAPYHWHKTEHSAAPRLRPSRSSP